MKSNQEKYIKVSISTHLNLGFLPFKKKLCIWTKKMKHFLGFQAIFPMMETCDFIVSVKTKVLQQT